jgi:hypothetical protein
MDMLNKAKNGAKACDIRESLNHLRDYLLKTISSCKNKNAPEAIQGHFVLD